MSGLGLLGPGAHIDGENLLVSNAGTICFSDKYWWEIGDFKQCTFAH